MSTISQLLREKDLALKKINKEVGLVIAVTTSSRTTKLPTEFVNASSYFQSVYDHLKNVCELLSKIRYANAALMTDAPDYFTGKNMSVVDCRQNLLGSGNVGLPSTIYLMKQLHIHLSKQVKKVKDDVQAHNNLKNAELKKLLDEKFRSHNKEREVFTNKSDIPNDFESNYAYQVDNMTKAFMAKNWANYYDPTNVFPFLTNLGNWISDFDRLMNVKINKANNKVIEDNQVDLVGQVDSNLPCMSLEELIKNVKDQSAQIKTEIERLVAVSWTIGENEPVNKSVHTASVDLNRILKRIESYQRMQSAWKRITTITQLNVQNPLTDKMMSAVDVVDFQNLIVPYFRKMLDTYESQKRTAVNKVASEETTVRSNIMKLLEGNMSSSNSKPSPDNLKKYIDELMESMVPHVEFAKDINVWIEKYEKVTEYFDTVMINALATTNANTMVPITWTLVESPHTVNSWDTVDTMQQFEQYPLSKYSSDEWGASVTEDWGSAQVAATTGDSKYVRPTNISRRGKW